MTIGSYPEEILEIKKFQGFTRIDEFRRLCCCRVKIEIVCGSWAVSSQELVSIVKLYKFIALVASAVTVVLRQSQVQTARLQFLSVSGIVRVGTFETCCEAVYWLFK